MLGSTRRSWIRFMVTVDALFYNSVCMCFERSHWSLVSCIGSGQNSWSPGATLVGSLIYCRILRLSTPSVLSMSVLEFMCRQWYGGTSILFIHRMIPRTLLKNGWQIKTIISLYLFPSRAFSWQRTRCSFLWPASVIPCCGGRLRKGKYDPTSPPAKIYAWKGRALYRCTPARLDNPLLCWSINLTFI